MIWFENKDTGQQWLVSDPKMIARLEADETYKTIADPTAKPKARAKPKAKEKQTAEDASQS